MREGAGGHCMREGAGGECCMEGAGGGEGGARRRLRKQHAAMSQRSINSDRDLTSSNLSMKFLKEFRISSTFYFVVC